MPRTKPKIAIATGDPGIGPEISLKAALDPAVRNACNPILVSDRKVLARHARACGIVVDLHVIARIADAGCSDRRIVDTTLHVSVAEAVALITRERVGRAIRAADAALKRIGIEAVARLAGSNVERGAPAR
jgi:4-hydroxythreonine-4-phosphate dehydrogenase